MLLPIPRLGNTIQHVDFPPLLPYHFFMPSDYVKKRIQREIAEAREAGPPYELRLIKLGLSGIPLEVFEYDDWELLDFSADAVVDRDNVTLDEEYWWEVHFDNNEIGAVPAEIAVLQQLKELIIDQNFIYFLPPELGECRSLERLSFRNNFIQKFPPELGKLDRLKYLDLSFNSIAVLPPEIVGLENLTHLDLRSNALEALPPEIGSLRELRYLDLGNYPEKGMFADTIERFDLQRNRLRELPAELADLQKLETFLCDGNPLEYPPIEEFEEDDFRALYWFFGREEPDPENELI